MNTVGIIAEYNPFHNGHKYQIQKAIENSCATHVVAIMSGNFVQRGECAIMDKWTRAKLAIMHGADLVIELPTIYATQSAGYFAKGAILSLNAMGIINSISFGTECDSIDNLQKCADVIVNEPKNYRETLNYYLNEGYGFAYSRAKAVEKTLNFILPDTPNDILALEYLIAMKKYNVNFDIYNIKRISNFHDGFGSAFYIRSAIKENKPFREFVSDITHKELKTKNILSAEDFTENIIYKIRSSSSSMLSKIADCNEGIENRIKNASYQSSTIEEIIEKSKTKRYTTSKIRRILFSILLGITNDDLKLKPTYLRVLAFNDKGREILKEMKTKASLPVITKLNTDITDNILQKDINATDIYFMHTKEKGRMDFLTSPLYITNNPKGE